MTKYFMAGTPHAGFEIMMMLPPQRRPALAAGHSYKPGDCDCRYCIEAERKRRFCRKASGCVCFGERSAAGCLTHGELAESLGSDAAMKRLSGRISRLLPPQTLTPFADEAHRKRMALMTAGMKKDALPFIAAVFLLSADSGLWEKSRLAVHEDAVDFGKIDIRGIGPDGYALLQSAKDMHDGGCRLTMDDLIDPDVISGRLFRLIISAFVIRRYGLSAEIIQ